MTTETVTPAETAAKRADQLERGDWITAGPYAGIDGTDDAEVLFVYPYAGSKVAVTIQEATVTGPTTIHLQADEKCLLLTAEEIAKLQRAAERRRLVDDLRAFTSLVAGGLPFPEQLHISVAVDTRAQVVALAEALGVEAGPWIKTGLSVRWPADRKSYEPGFQFMAYTGEELPDPDPTGMAYSRESESDVAVPVPAGVEGHPEGRAAGEAV